METMYFDEGVRAAKRQQLESSMLDVSNSFPNDQSPLIWEFSLS